MIVNAIDRLAAANPVVDLPAVAPVEDALIIADENPQPPYNHVPRHRKAPKRAVAGVLLAAGATVVALLLAAGSTGPGVNVAAAAFAATSPEPGVLHAVFESRIVEGRSGRSGKPGAVFRQEQWIDTTTGQERERDTISEPSLNPQMSERASSPALTESWSSTQPGLIYTERAHPLSVFPAFGDLLLSGINGVSLFRQLYREGKIRVVGHEHHGAQTLWLLESGDLRLGSRRARLVLLVNPHTFLPTVETLEESSNTGAPRILSQSRLVIYSHAADHGTGAPALTLRAQHPHAHVTIRSGPVFRSGRQAETVPKGP